MKKILLSIAQILFFVPLVSSQVTLINSNNGLDPYYPLAPDKTILISDVDRSLWVTDGTSAGTIKLSNTIVYEDGEAILNGKFIFKGSTPATGVEMFITDGTIAGTKLISDIYPGINGSEPDNDMAVLNGYVYFTASRPAEGRELWRTDGTAAGTTLVKDIVPGTTGSNVTNGYTLFSNGNFLLLNINTVAEGNELWISDGTMAGTNSLKNINPGSNSSDAEHFFAFNNMVLFTATDATHGMELWKTDGTTAGTMLVKDINPLAASAFSPFNFAFFYVFNGKAFFTADDGTNGEEIWSTDGTTVNTTLLKNIHSDPIAITLLYNAMKVGNKFFFTITDFSTRFEMWESDGTTAGTKLFKAFTPADAGGIPFIYASYEIDFNAPVLNYSQPLFQGNKFFFSAGTLAEGNELWITDGTLAGTSMVKNIGPGADDGVAFPGYIYTATDLYFVANDGIRGNELWKSNGTEAGTTLVHDINPGPGNSEPYLPFFINNGKILFTADDGVNPNYNLYVINGVSPLPIRLSQFTVALNASDALLQWTTAQEVNSKDFIVQRSNDGVHFIDINTIAATGSSAVNRHYNFVDPGIINNGKNIVYYRLVFRDHDGAITFSNVVALNIKNKSKYTVKLLSNPVGSSLNVAVSGAANQVQFAINTINGIPVFKNTTAMVNGQVNLPVGNLPPGIYVLIATSNGERRITRFIKR